MNEEEAKQKTLSRKLMRIHNIQLDLQTRLAETQAFMGRLALQIFAITASQESGKKITDLGGQSAKQFEGLLQNYISVLEANLNADQEKSLILEALREDMEELNFDKDTINRILNKKHQGDD